MIFLADVEYGQIVERFCTDAPGRLVDSVLSQKKYTEGDIVITLERLRDGPLHNDNPGSGRPANLTEM
jgi:hypothetical protein